MIGNDVVDLVLARQESNWERRGYLQKLFTNDEQQLILNSKNPEITVWNLWSRKEAAYKVYNRATGMRAFIPLNLECLFETAFTGKVLCNEFVYYTSTIINSQSIHTIAVNEEQHLSRIEYLNDESLIEKEKGVPFIGNKPISISEHGRFRHAITLCDL